MDDEADLSELVVVQQVTAVEDECWSLHGLEDHLPVEPLVLIPLRHDDDSVRTLARHVRVGIDGDELGHANAIGQRHLHRSLGDARIGDDELSPLGQQRRADSACRRVPGVGGVLLVGEAEDCEALAADGIEHGRDNRGRKSPLLPLVHLEYRIPVRGDFLEAVVLAKIDKVTQMGLVARAAKADRGGEMLAADARVDTDGVRHLRHVRARLLAQR
mmetsp:Transcript_22795/g.57996  ORF Transcript_22795/g.57996 Transcript_22795/m.57996 type:complete len:216 (+) Transcript_22795:616-1263(+)